MIGVRILSWREMQQLETPGAHCSCCPLPMYVFFHHLTTSMKRLISNKEHQRSNLNHLAHNMTLTLWYLKRV